MDAEDGRERTELEPADEELAELGIVEIAAGNEAANVGGPVRHAADGVIQSSRDLALEGDKVGEHVARPRSYPVALRAGVGGAGEDEDALFV